MIGGIGDFLQSLSEAADDGSDAFFENRDQNFIFIFEIKINGAIGYAGLAGNLRNFSVIESFPGKNLGRRPQNPFTFLGFPGFLPNEFHGRSIHILLSHRLLKPDYS
ncbi:MAG: hypothetical protein Q9P14_11680 [candidate division KSB1 bacterium]|nr:hypothetical protein [candidate division KSB1 bacterium]